MNEKLNYYDISPEISPELAVWPGDVPFQRKLAVDFESGGNLLLSSIQATVHLGAHTDAPNHYHREGQGIHARSLEYYFGPCQICSVSVPVGTRIQPSHLKNVQILAKRILFKTGSYPDPNRWTGNFAALSPDLIQFLSDRGVILVGIDTPSVDLSEDKELVSHQAIYRNDMAILEGVVLKDVPDGIYTLVALPLKLREADASPVRAILVRDKVGL